MIRSSLALALVAVLASTAAADVATPPAGWKHDDDASDQTTAKSQARSHFGGARTTVSVQAWISPDHQGSLWITRAQAPVAATARDAAASIELRELAESPRRLGGAQIEATAQHWDAETKQLEGMITWNDPSVGLRQIARILVAGDAERILAVTGECVLATTAPPAIEKACAGALATLTSTIDPKQRVTLAIVDVPATAPAPATPSAPAPSEPSVMAAPHSDNSARIDSGPSGTLMTISPAEREPDRRPIYLGAGIMVLAALFWWNRRRRDRFDHDEHGTGERSSRADDDADDLHDAARGDPPKDES